MSILLDECIPRKLAECIHDHEVLTVRSLGWHKLKNGSLLDKAQHDFDFFITVDKNIPYQLDLLKYNISLIILSAKSNSIIDLKPLAPLISCP